MPCSLSCPLLRPSPRPGQRAGGSNWRRVRTPGRTLEASLLSRYQLRVHGWCIGAFMMAFMWAVSHTQMVLGAASAYGARLVSAGSREVAEGWIQVYAPTDPSQYPHAEAAKAELAMMNYRDVFAQQLEMYLAALELVVIAEGEESESAGAHTARA